MYMYVYVCIYVQLQCIYALQYHLYVKELLQRFSSVLQRKYTRYGARQFPGTTCLKKTEAFKFVDVNSRGKIEKQTYVRARKNCLTGGHA